jgi:hypothetical protein
VRGDKPDRDGGPLDCGRPSSIGHEHQADDRSRVIGGRRQYLSSLHRPMDARLRYAHPLSNR